MTTEQPNAGYGCPVDRITEFLRVWWVESAAVLLALAGVVEGLASATVDGVSRAPAGSCRSRSR